MKVLILGSDGMIGHKIAQSLNDDCELILSSRKSISLDTIGVKRGKILLHDLITDNLDSMLKKIFPDLIINISLPLSLKISNDPVIILEPDKAELPDTTCPLKNAICYCCILL